MVLTSYLGCALDKDRRAETIRKAKAVLKQVDFNIIAVRGVSGLLIGPTLAHLLGKHLLVVRKSTDSSHSSHTVEGRIPSRRDKVLIVDDFTSSGATIANTVKEIERVTGFNVQWAGFYGYQQADFRRGEPEMVAKRIYRRGDRNDY